MTDVSPVKLPPDECNWILLMMSPTLIQVMAWCRQATSHYLSQCWPRSMTPIDVTRPQWVITLRPRQNRRHATDSILKCIFLNENVSIPFKISLKFVPKGPINNIPSLAQIKASRRPGAKPLSESVIVSLSTNIYVTWPQWVNTLKPGLNGHHLQTIFSTLFSWMKIIVCWFKVHWIVFLSVPIDNKSALA